MSETYKKITYDSKKVQVESAIRDGNGVKIDTNYQRKPAVYERTTQSSTSTTCTLIQFNASDYKANGYLAHFRFRVKSTLQDAYPSDNEFIVNYSYLSPSIICINNKKTITNDIVQDIYAYCPSSNTYLDTGNYFIAFKAGRASTNFIIEVMEADVPYTIPATMSASTTTDTIYNTLSPGSYTGDYPLMWTGIAAGSVAGSADSASSANLAHYLTKIRMVGEALSSYSLCGIDTSGSVFKLLTADKKFPLPITLTNSRENVNAGSRNTLNYNDASVSYSSLSSTSYQGGSGYICPTLTASDGGKTLYIRGSLDTVDGKPVFVPDGNVTLDMSTGGYTYIPFGELYKSSSSAPTNFYWKFENTTAYTFDANGKLTHIDGKQIAPKVTISSSAPSGGSNGDIWIQY